MGDSVRLNSAKRKKVSKKKLKEDVSDPPESESSEEELDLTKECHPISHYVNDRAEMINQMFSVIKGKKLKAMLPPILSNLDTEQLKLQCLDQLLGMSEKRIQCIIDGQVLDSSSESEVLSDESESSKSGSGSSEMSEGESRASAKRKRGKTKSDGESVGKPAKAPKMPEESHGPDEGKTLLEILELEMRARAIRALLNQGNDNPSGPSNASQARNGDVVDLTAGDDDEFPRVIKTEPVSSEQEQSFADKVEKTASAKKEEDIKKHKLLLETEMRNRLIKKKTYRTRQQRIDNDEEELAAKPKEQEEIIPTVEVKQEKEDEPKQPYEIVIEDPEEGEVSTEEEEEPVVVKQEKEVSPQPEEQVEKVMDGERITAIDDGAFVANENVQLEEGHLVDEEVQVVENEPEKTHVEEILPVEEGVSGEESQNVTEGETSQDSMMQPAVDEEISWRERWLKNDEVQKVVKSSRICGKVKKRIASKKKEIVAQREPTPEVASVEKLPVLEMEGSVTEYEKLCEKAQPNEIATASSAQDGNTKCSSVVSSHTLVPDSVESPEALGLKESVESECEITDNSKGGQLIEETSIAKSTGNETTIQALNVEDSGGIGGDPCETE